MKRACYLLPITVIFFVVACGSPNLEGDDPSAGASDVSATMSQSEASLLMHQSNPLAPQILRPADHGSGFGWKKDRCFLCHPMKTLKTIHEYSPALSESFSRLGEADTGACLYCHGSNGIAGVTTETYRCMLCHTDESIVTSADMFAGRNMHDMNADGWIDNADCVTCHAFSDMNGQINVAVDFRRGATDYEDISGFCLNCHDGNGAFGILPPELSTGTGGNNIYSTYKGIGETLSVQMQTADIHGARKGARAGHGQGHGSSGQCSEEGQAASSEAQEPCSGHAYAELRGSYAGGMAVACLDCHQVHSSNNPYLITESGASAAFADETARAAAVSVTENNFSQLCAVCHTSSDGPLTDNGLTQVVHPGTYSAYCTDCHYHGAGFGADVSGLF